MADRHGAMVRLVDCWSAGPPPAARTSTVVFEQPPSPPIRSTVIAVAHAPRPRRDSADDEIVRLVLADAEPGAVRVVTSDLWLGDRVHAAGATVEPASAFRALIEERLMAPTTRYARSGDASIAYQVVGDGPLDLALRARLDLADRAPVGGAGAAPLPRAARGVRAADPVRPARARACPTACSDGTLEQDVEDALAVLDAAGSERAALLTYGLGGPVGALLAAEHPERVGALIMYASVAARRWAPDYDWAMTPRSARR